MNDCPYPDSCCTHEGGSINHPPDPSEYTVTTLSGRTLLGSDHSPCPEEALTHDQPEAVSLQVRLINHNKDLLKHDQIAARLSAVFDIPLGVLMPDTPNPPAPVITSYPPGSIPVTVANTLRQLAEWAYAEYTPDELRQLADAVENEDYTYSLTCPMCQEIECDEGCPLQPLRTQATP